MSDADKCQKIMDLAKRRGFFWLSYDLYGGVSGFIDYGPLGALMKRKIEQKWADTFIRKERIMFIETPIITPKIVFEASGHTIHFSDLITSCKSCGRSWRADHLLEEQANISGEGLDIKELDAKIHKHNIKCPECSGELGEPQLFNELFETNIGPYSGNTGYGRPETAQGIFTNFKRLYELARNKLPFGVAQIGKCVRNEISPRQGPIRLRELTIMEFEFFFNPENCKCDRIKGVETENLRILHEELIQNAIDTPVEVSVKEALVKGYIKSEWTAYFMALAKRFMRNLGVPDKNQCFIEKLSGQRAHYSAQTFDQVIELTRWGLVEVSGHALRTDYDLKMHMAYSGVDLRVLVPYEKSKKVKKSIILPSKKNLFETFGGESVYLSRLLGITSPQEINEAFSRNGYYDLKGIGKSYKILPEHVQFNETFVEETGSRFLPSVVEPSFGSDRILYATLENAYVEKEGRAVLQLPKDISPVEIAVFPLVSKDGLLEKTMNLYGMLNDSEYSFTVEYESSGSIGKRYARADEAGIPIAITVDYQTLEDETVTLRDRDSWRQVRTEIDKLPLLLSKYFKSKIEFLDIGKPIN
ncbi:MAG: glycine--tRNA ligase [Candidatus Bathyarchaeota archaeon]